MKKPLFYKNHILVKPFRKLLARFWDLVTAVLLASVFLALMEGFFQLSPYFQKNREDNYTAFFDLKTKKDLSGLYSANGIAPWGEGEDQLTRSYMETVLIITFKRNSYLDYHNGNYKYNYDFDSGLDYCFTYFSIYKPDFLDCYPAEDEYLNICGEEKYYDLLVSHTDETFFTPGTTPPFERHKGRIKEAYHASKYPYFSLETAKDIDQYLFDNTNEKGKEAYDQVFKGYKECLQIGRKEFTTYNSLYKAASESVKQAKEQIVLSYDLELIFSYFLSLFIAFLFIPLFNADKRTIGEIMLRIGVEKKDGTSLTKKDLWINFSLKAIKYFGFAALPLLIIYREATFTWLLSALLGNLYVLIALGAFSVLSCLADYISSLMNHHDGNSLSEEKLGLVFIDFRKSEITKDQSSFEYTPVSNLEEKKDK